MRKSLRQHQHKPPMDVDSDSDPNPPLSESEFSFAIARLAVAQICQTVGFKGGAQSRALEALTDIATRYLRAIAKLGAASANSHGRTESNLPDIIVALEELASVQGFLGSSSLRSHSTLYTSAVIKDLMKFVRYREEIPLAQPMPTRSSIVFGGVKGEFWKCRSDGDSMNRWYNDGEKLRRHVPRWLPDVPVVVVVTEEEEEGKENGRDERERIWGCLNDREEEENRVCCWERVEKEEENKEIEMLGKRGKVKFKIRVGVAAADSNMGEGMVRNLNLNLRCGGGGVGKRVVVCNGGGGSSGGDENESKGLIARKKPR